MVVRLQKESTKWAEDLVAQVHRYKDRDVDVAGYGCHTKAELICSHQPLFEKEEWLRSKREAENGARCYSLSMQRGTEKRQYKKGERGAI